MCAVYIIIGSGHCDTEQLSGFDAADNVSRLQSTQGPHPHSSSCPPTLYQTLRGLRDPGRNVCVTLPPMLK